MKSDVGEKCWKNNVVVPTILSEAPKTVFSKSSDSRSTLKEIHITLSVY